MRKEEQLKINSFMISVWNDALQELRTSNTMKRDRLRTCQAWVHETQNFYILRSYNTFIACIHKESDTLYDMLRYEYGYTATSAQHIAKFRSDYGKSKWGCENSLRYY